MDKLYTAPSRNSSCTVLPTCDTEWIQLQDLGSASSGTNVVQRQASNTSIAEYGITEPKRVYTLPLLNVRERLSSSTRSSEPSSIAVPSNIPRYGLDNIRQHALGYKIQHIQGCQGRKRFEGCRSYRVVEHDETFDGRHAEIHPGHFSAAEFAAIWASTPTQLEDEAYHEEKEFRGTYFRLWVSNRFIEPVRRGSSFIIGGLFSHEVRYIATIRRGINTHVSWVQLNVYSKEQDLILAACLDWPAVILEVPNYACQVPMPQQLYKYYTDIIAPPPTKLTLWAHHMIRDVLKFKRYSRHTNKLIITFILSKI